MIAVPSMVFVSIWLFLLFRIYYVNDGSELFVVKVLLEQDLNLSCKLIKLGGFKWFLGLVLLMCLILTNLYRGEVTTNMTLPMPRSYIKTVKESIEKGFRIILPTNLQETNNIFVNRYISNRTNPTYKYELLMFSRREVQLLL
jgi:hypothetical protein